MRIVSRPAAMRELSRRARRSGESVGFVPTMGALHPGHIALMNRARRENRRLAVSVFVNPLQFGPKEDYERYPRNDLQDARLCRWAGTDWLYMPPARLVYPPGFATHVAPGPMGDVLEGAVRPGHFAGVLTVVLKLLQMVEPDTLYLGQKDAQQAALVTQMVRDFDLPVRVVVCPTVRERDGVALSSRNVYLSPEDRARARGIVKALRAGRDLARSGRRSAGAILTRVKTVLRREGRPDGIDYVALVDPRTFEPLQRVEQRGLLLAAARFGRTRLIDNIQISAAARAEGVR